MGICVLMVRGVFQPATSGRMPACALGRVRIISGSSPVRSLPDRRTHVNAYWGLVLDRRTPLRLPSLCTRNGLDTDHNDLRHP